MITKKTPPKMGARRLPEIDPEQEASLLRKPTPGETKAVQSRRKKNRWVDMNQRLTFYIPRLVLAALEQEVAKGQRSKSAIIVEALSEHLGV